jgi:two-component system, cell cycle sensor histidine kinase and response regulator CckA
VTDARMNAMLADLRSRAENGRPDLASPISADELARALHELDVYHAELEIQNQDLLVTQRALSGARDKYHALFDAALTPMFSVSPQGVVVDANRAMTLLLDRSRERLVGRPFVVCLDAGEPPRYFEHLKAIRETARAQQIELTLRTSTGRLRQVVVRSCPLGNDDAGTFLCHATDVTEERAAQRDRTALELRLRESEKLEAIGRVAANIAHDVNNVLMAIVSIAEFVRGEFPADSHGAVETDALIEAAWRGGRLMRGLLGLSRPSTRVRQTVDVRGLVEQVVRLCRHTKPGVEVTARLPSEALVVEADEDELLQALLNLAKNALEATSRGAVTLTCRVVGDAHRPEVELVVTDTGSGMDEVTLERATEPLFTTKSQDGGSGLGLTLVHRTVTSLGGALELASHEGSGTTVTLRLPLSHDVAHGSRPDHKPVTTALRVLLVDDDPSTRHAVKRQLTHGGVTVHDFSEGPTALASVESGLVVDAAIVDVNMPIWTGPELVERLLALEPELPVLFITGASGNLIPDWMLKRPQALLLQKPWPRETLLNSLRTIVAPPDGEGGALRNAPS